MITYVLGAGASLHAGYPLCSALWSEMAGWVIESQPADSQYRKAIAAVVALNGPVVDVESVFTDLDLGQGAFQAMADDKRNELKWHIRSCLKDYFRSICNKRLGAPLYNTFAGKLEKGDCIITFNYDVS